MENTVKVISLLENTKFSANNDLIVLHTALELIFSQNKGMWIKGSYPREQLLELLSGKLILDTSAFQAKANLEDLVAFLQGIIILAVSLLNGIGRSPVSVQRQDNQLKVKFANKPQPININIGKYDQETGKLVREFKTLYYGRADGEALSKNELKLIKEAFQETRTRLKNEKSFLERVAKNPLQIFLDSSSNFSAGLFLVLSALPIADLNNLLINIGSYLPPELEEINEDMFRVNVRNYFSTTTQDMHELYKKIRMLLKLYYGKHRQIISIIVKEKTKDLFKEILQNKTTKEALQANLKNAQENQFELRISTLNSLIKLL